MLEINGYQIFAELRRDPEIRVFKAFEQCQQRVVIIKLLQMEETAQPPVRLHNLQESTKSIQPAHPNIRRVLDSGVVNNQPYLVLEHVDGPTLHELLREHKRLPLEVGLFIAKEIAKALAAVHATGALHNDIKPQNIFLSGTGEVKLGESGSRRDFDETTEIPAGSPAYMSPEQIIGKGLTPASDLFSFGAVLYKMITGETAFANPTLASTLHHITEWDPVPIARLRPETPAALIALCNKLLAKASSQRYHDATEVLREVIAVERTFNMKATSKTLVEFLEAVADSPEVPMVDPISTVSDFNQHKHTTNQRRPFGQRSRNDFGVRALIHATIFLAGVLFVRGVKEYRQWQWQQNLMARKVAPVAAASLYDVNNRMLRTPEMSIKDRIILISTGKDDFPIANNIISETGDSIEPQNFDSGKDNRRSPINQSSTRQGVGSREDRRP